jgi:hypothetical protein
VKFRDLFLVTVVLMTSFAAHAEKATAKNTGQRKPSAANDRPPQFVLMAFDGSKDIGFWDESMNAADAVPTMENTRKLRFTYFINPTYYLAPQNKKSYDTPVLGPGHSCIGWSGSVSEIPERIARTNKAFETGHEIGSHANAHCNQKGDDKGDPMFGHPWGEAEWNQEFEQFNYLLFDAFKLNGVKPVAASKYANGFSFTPQDIVGFRAPQLAYTPGLWPTLKKFNFRYDTSMSSAPDYWPQRLDWGGWKFPLGSIKIAGTQRKTLSMDFNWLYYHTGGRSKPDITDAERDRMSQQMLDSYKYYFKNNYFGGRGPVHIGHHFAKWNGGAYWIAMKAFANFVCNKPEVRCVTYREYADWLDGLTPATFDAYRHGKFERLKDDKTIKDIATPVLADIRLESDAKHFEAVVADADKTRVKALGWKSQLQVNFVNQPDIKVSREQLRTQFKGQEILIRAALVNRSGVEMNWQTFKVQNLGTPQENLVGPLEDQLLSGETADSHEGE